MRDSLDVLEFNAIKQIVAGFAVMELTKQRCFALEYSTDYYRVEEDLKITDEAIRIVYGFGRCPVDYIHDIRGSIEKAEKNGFLSIEELYRVASQADGVQHIQSFKDSLNMHEIDNFSYFVDSMVPCIELKKAIERCISPELTIYDDASVSLKSIRKSIRNLELEIRHKLDAIIHARPDYLAEPIVTIRNDRLVIPVKSSYKSVVGGIIHDESDSGQTCYVEPSSVVILNAQVSSLKISENQEIDRILRSLSEQVSLCHDDLLKNLMMALEIDFMFAKGEFGRKYNAKPASLSHNQEIILKHARHPLIDQDKVVANDFTLGDGNRRIYLISGPNTGGKTVALKTVGLLSIMNQAGFPIPVDGECVMGIFESFFVDIGDEQSIEQSLSTFSSHMSKLIHMVENVNDKSLVLVDELGGGTDPKEGEAIAMAILDYFHRRGAVVLSTTHYSNLKTFALENEYITNASMMFDKEKFKPLYKLETGISGQSYAFEISRNLGLSEEIIEKAKMYKNHYSTELDHLIEKVDKKSLELNDREKQLNQMKLDLASKQDMLDQLVAKNNSLNEKIRENANELIGELVSSAEEEIKDMMSNLKNNPDAKLHNYIDAKSKIADLADNSNDIDDDNNEFEINDYVLVKTVGKKGKITRKKGEEYSVLINGILVQVSGNNLEHAAIDKEKKKIVILKKISGQFEESRHYSEKEINTILKAIFEDYATIRRYLIEYGFMMRTTDCKEYWIK